LTEFGTTVIFGSPGRKDKGATLIEIVDCSRQLSSQKIHFKQVLVFYKQGRQADKEVRQPTKLPIGLLRPFTELTFTIRQAILPINQSI
jgi:hypothetical protein